MKEFRNEIRWTLVVIVLVGLAIYALWPRDPATDTGGTSTAGGPSAEPVSPQQRAQAGLRPCPQEPGGPQQWDGVSGICEADGTPVDLKAAVAGEPTLVNVWATWCSPCRAELPALQTYSEQPHSVRVLGVQVQSPEDDGLDLLRRLGVHYPVVHDRDNRIQRALPAPNTVPMSYVITGNGEVRRLDPTVFESAQQVDQAVRQALGQGGEHW